MKLLFKNPVMQEGLNITVRRGDKWLGYRGPVDVVKPLEDSSLYVVNVVQTLEVKKFNDLAQSGENQLLRLEHDPACRTYSGLLRAMREAYGNLFSILEPVTVVFFIVPSLKG